MQEIRKNRDNDAFTLIEVLVVVFILGILLALLLPAVQSAREAARRTQCQNNLKQIGLALNMYHDSWRAFPAAYTPDLHYTFYIYPDRLAPGWAWAFMLLPYLEQRPLYDAANFDPVLGQPVNGTVTNTSLMVLLCPSAGGVEQPIEIAPFVAMNGTAPAQYIGSSGWLDSTIIDAKKRIPGTGILIPNGNVSMGEIADGTSTTFIVGERSRNVADAVWPFVSGAGRETGSLCTKVNWSVQSCVSSLFMILGRTGPASDIMSGAIPSGMTPNSPVAGADGFASQHPGGCYFAFADGSVRQIKDSINVATFRALATRAGAESIGSEQY